MAPFRRRMTTKRRGARRKRKVSKRTSFNVMSTSPPKPLTTRGNGLPASRKATLRYVSEITINPGVTPSNYIFTANGLFDPDITGVGHQPMGFDQYATFYNHYTVIAANITVECINSSTTTPALVGINITPAATFTGTNTASGRIEQRDSVHKILGVLGSTNTATIIKQKVAPLKYLHKHIGNDDVNAHVTTNPSEQVFFNIWSAGLGNSDGPAVDMLVTVNYIVIWTEPKMLLQS